MAKTGHGSGRNGADPNIGRRVPELFRHAGLQDVAVAATARAYLLGHSRRTLRMDLVRAMRPHVPELGLASEAELDELDAAARAHLSNPDPGGDAGPVLPGQRPQTGGFRR
jgi:hypothetical protein